MYGKTVLIVGAALVLAALPTIARDRIRTGAEFEPRGDWRDGGVVGTLTVTGLEGALGYPVYAVEHLRVIAAAEVRWDRLDFGGDRQEMFDVYHVSFPVTAVIRGGGEGRWLVSLAPGLATDFEHITSDDVRLFSMGLYLRDITERLSFGAGVVYNQSFGSPRAYPGLSLRWEPVDGWLLDLAMPRPRITYRPTPGFSASLHAEPAGDAWSVSLDGRETDLERERLRLGLALEFEVRPGWWLTLDAGADIDRSVRLDRDREAPVLDADLDDGGYYRCALSWRGADS